MGPGTHIVNKILNKIRPVSFHDRIALDHDIDYLRNAGKSTYEADLKAIKLAATRPNLEGISMIAGLGTKVIVDSVIGPTNNAALDNKTIEQTQLIGEELAKYVEENLDSFTPNKQPKFTFEEYDDAKQIKQFTKANGLDNMESQTPLIVKPQKVQNNDPPYTPHQSKWPRKEVADFNEFRRQGERDPSPPQYVTHALINNEPETKPTQSKLGNLRNFHSEKTDSQSGFRNLAYNDRFTIVNSHPYTKMYKTKPLQTTYKEKLIVKQKTIGINKKNRL